MLYFCSSDNLLSASWLRMFDGFQNVSGKILYFVFRPKTLLFSDVRCFCFSAEITNIARYPAGCSPRCSKPWPGWILGRIIITKQSADFKQRSLSVVSVLQQFHWRMRRSDVTWRLFRRDVGRIQNQKHPKHSERRSGTWFSKRWTSSDWFRSGSGPLPAPLSVFEWQQPSTLSRFLHLIFESDRRSDEFKAAHFVNMNVVSDCDFSMSLFFMDTESFIMLIWQIDLRCLFYMMMMMTMMYKWQTIWVY